MEEKQDYESPFNSGFMVVFGLLLILGWNGSFTDTSQKENN